MADERCPSCLQEYVATSAPDEPVSERLAAKIQRRKQESDRNRHQAARRNILIGSVLLVGGIGATLFSYFGVNPSSSEGTYVIFYGAIIASAVELLHGLRQYGQRSD